MIDAPETDTASTSYTSNNLFQDDDDDCDTDLEECANLCGSDSDWFFSDEEGTNDGWSKS